MAFKFDIPATILLVLLAFTLKAYAKDFCITNYGGKCDGKTDSTKALLSAWKEACAAPTCSKVIIPKGDFLVGEVKLDGPCKAPIQLVVTGNLKAPLKVAGDGWINFNNVNGLTISGSGVFDGQGEQAWKSNDCTKNKNCKMLTMNLRFNFITNGMVRGVTSLNSKNFHVNVLGCKNFTFDHFNISAPECSPNTDGIHIGRSDGITILNTHIATGDDCVSLGDGCKNINVKGVTCGPGHGISIGSLGRYPNEEPVCGVFVKNCTLTQTQNGVRIKSWPAMYGGSAANMHFEDITMNNVSNPVLIDQVYCPWNQCNTKVPSKVAISDVSFNNIRGTSQTELGVKLSCSAGIPCQKVKLSNINLKYIGALPAPNGLKSECTNVKPAISGTLSAKGC